MFGNQTSINRKPKDEAEKPFWISFADLMTALMILFLVVMSVALLAVTRKISDTEKGELERGQEIKQLLELLATNVKECGQTTVWPERYVIDFGSQATFRDNSHQLTPDQVHYLRQCVPEILAIAANDLGKKWIKRIIVEGYADPRGSYLYNLNLSLQRSQRVLCVLLGPSNPRDRSLTAVERKQVRDLFLVGGFSFNSAKASFEGSRRAELRLEFWGFREPRASDSEDVAIVETDAICQLDVPPRTPQVPARPSSPATPSTPLFRIPFGN